MHSPSIDRAANKAQNNPIFVNLARAGYVVTGVLHILIGWLATRIALGSGGGEASNSGAMAQIAQSPGGRVLLWVMVLGIGALALWHFTLAVVGSGAKDKAKGVALGAVFSSIGVTMATIAAGGTKSDSATASDVTATALEYPGGRIAVIIAGLIVVGVGVYGLYKGVTRSFVTDLEAGATGGHVGTGIVVAGAAGYAMRGVAFLVLGGMIVWAAVSKDPAKAGGLDTALQTIGAQPFGATLLLLVAIGFVLYGIYSIARARYTSEI